MHVDQGLMQSLFYSTPLKNLKAMRSDRWLKRLKKKHSILKPSYDNVNDRSKKKYNSNKYSTLALKTLKISSQSILLVRRQLTKTMV